MNLIRTSLSLDQAAQCGMGLAVLAREHPDRLAIASPHGDRSFDLLNRRANQLARALRARGLRRGDSIALLCSNRPEFAAVYYAALRAGLRVTPINWQLTASEAAYILDDCEAACLLADARFSRIAAAASRGAQGATLRFAIAGSIHGFESYEDALDEQPEDDIEDPVLGTQMLYTSGTTGRPKGVFRKPAPAAARQGFAVVAECAGYRPGSDLHLCTGPLFHTAPLAFSLIMPLNLGCSVVLMDDWDSEHALALIEGYRITHTHMVPTMFHRLLGLPEEVRAARDLSSLRMVLHGAAPCPIAVKRAMIDWLGPVLHEYYAATEGWGSFVPAKEWLRKPGTVGKPDDGQIEIRDAEGKLQPPGTPDLVYLRSPAGAGFEYYKDSGKTSAVYSKEGDYFTLGDIGYLDEDGYLVLCARSADVIISGGVNIYPAEVEAILLEHPAVGDSATVGAPNEEWGEEVIAVVELIDGELPSEGLAQELIGHCRDRLASYKCPRRIDFVEALPRYETGKIYRRLVRDHYWEDREARI